MAFTATAVDSTPNSSGVRFNITVVIDNITRVLDVSIDDLTGPPALLMEFDPALKVILKALWYGSAGTPAQKITALKAGVNLANATLKIRDYANGVDVTS